MGGFFSLDSKFMQAMSRVADLIILNVIYLGTCLPVITIGAASTALYTVCFRLGTAREGSLVKGYFRAFRDEFRQATLIWLFLLLFGAASCVNIILFLSMDGWMHYLFFLFVLFLVIVVMMASYAFPLLSQFRNDSKSVIKRADLQRGVSAPDGTDRGDQRITLGTAADEPVYVLTGGIYLGSRLFCRRSLHQHPPAEKSICSLHGA